MATFPFLTPELLASLQLETKKAVVHMIDTGTLPAGATPLTKAAATEMLRDFWVMHRQAIAESTVDFAFGLVSLATLPEEEIEDFEARINGLSPDQLAEIAEADAERSEALVSAIVDRRRRLVAALTTTGYVMVKGGLATALNLVLPGAGTVAAAAVGAIVDPVGSG